MIEKISRYSRNLRYVRENFGVPIHKQINDILSLRASNFLLGATDYFQFGLYDQSVISQGEIWRYVGWRYETLISQALNPRVAVMPAWDKLTCHHFLEGYADLKMPRLIAIYRPQGADMFGHISQNALESKDQLMAFLRNNEVWPLFAKPSYSQQGKGSCLITGYDISTDQLYLFSRDNLTVESFLDEYVFCNRKYYKNEAGFLFQEALCEHPSIAKITGTSSVSGIRAVVLNLGHNVVLERAIWKVCREGNITDNFERGVSGNLIAPIDVVTGCVGSGLDGFWPYAHQYESLPLTGKSIEEFTIPYWARVKDMCIHVANSFPLMKILHLDIAITDSGPVLIEINDMGATLFLQLHGQGLLSDNMIEALFRYGDKNQHPWLAKLPKGT